MNRVIQASSPSYDTNTPSLVADEGSYGGLPRCVIAEEGNIRFWYLCLGRS